MAKIFYMTVHEAKFGPGNGLSRYNLNEIFIDLSQNKVKMQYIFENFRCFYCFGKVSALDGENIDVFKNSSFNSADRCVPQLSPIELQLEFPSTRPSTR